jgi:hypothetical protein
MNDEELITAVRSQRDKVPMTTPVEEVISRGRSVRARRRIPAIGGALAVVAAAAVAVTVLVPGSHRAAPATTQLAAWTVAKHPNGDIYVTIHQLKNPAGLQRTLRADGLPANVSFSGPPLSAYCQPYNTPKPTLSAVAHFHHPSGTYYLVIRPSALPAGIGVSIFDDPSGPPPPAHPRTSGSTSHKPPPGITGPLSIGLVHATPKCTG